MPSAKKPPRRPRRRPSLRHCLVWGDTVFNAGAKPDELFDEFLKLGTLPICRALAGVQRFNGQTMRPISVAAHTLICETLLCERHEEARRGCPNTLRAWVLTHDIAEAFLGDVPAPLKTLPEMRGYRDLEDRIVEAARTAFGVFGASEAERRRHDAIVKDIDRLACSVEILAGFPPEKVERFRELGTHEFHEDAGLYPKLVNSLIDETPESLTAMLAERLAAAALLRPRE